LARIRCGYSRMIGNTGLKLEALSAAMSESKNALVLYSSTEPAFEEKKKERQASLPSGNLSGVEKSASNTLQRALQEKKLFVVVGAGVTMASVPSKAKSLSWTGIIDMALKRWEELRPNAKNKISLFRQLIQEGEFMSAAQAFKKALSPNEWASWLEDTFDSLKAEDTSLYDFLKLLQERGARIITTNYDTLIEEHTGMQALDQADVVGVGSFFTKTTPQVFRRVFHVHGKWDNPPFVVLDALDYQKVVAEGSSSGGAFIVQQHMQQLLTAHNVLFIGCGGTLDDPHFTALLKYADGLNRDHPNRHVLLQSGSSEAKTQEYPAVQRLNQGSHGDLLASLRNLLPSVTASPPASSADAPEPLCPAGPHVYLRLKRITDWLAEELPNHLSLYPSNLAFRVLMEVDHPVLYALGIDSDPDVAAGPLANLENNYSPLVVRPLKCLLAHAKHWSHKDGKVQRLVIFDEAVRPRWEVMSFFLFRFPMNASGSSDSCEIFNYQGPMEPERYMNPEVMKKNVEERALPPYLGDRKDFTAIAQYLTSHNVDMEGFDETEQVNLKMIIKAGEWLRRLCNLDFPLLSSSTSLAFAEEVEEWEDFLPDRRIHNGAVKIALVAAGARVEVCPQNKNLVANVQSPADAKAAKEYSRFLAELR